MKGRVRSGGPPISVHEAIVRITADIEPLPVEYVPLEEAHGRALAQDLAATLTQPPFPASAMDGYAVRAADLSTPPARLTVVGEAAAGRGFAGCVGPGQAVRIFTGAPIPDGADAVVMQELVRRLDDQAEFRRPTTNGAFIRPRGFDFREGDALLRAGRRLTARDLMLAASMNHAMLPVRRQPEVAILATGDELVQPGQTPGPWQIVASASYGLAAMARSAGSRPRLLEIARDRLDSIEARLDEAAGADVLLTVGGAAEGDYDLVGQALKRRGFVMRFSKVAMQPGKSTVFGRIGARRALGAPGNPVAALMCARVFLYPLIACLLGLPPTAEAPGVAILAADLPANGERQHYMRALLTPTVTGERSAAPLTSQDSSLTALLSQANGLIVRPPFAAAAAAGSRVPVLDLDF
jgi:molybdopterin molybdotransferase